MKLGNVNTNAERTPRIFFQSDIAERAKNGPSAEEIRKRAFEIHIERGGIHGRDLWDRFLDWLQAERELQEKCTNSEKVQKRNEMHSRSDFFEN